MSIKPFVSFVFACVAAVALVLVTADSSHAISKCKVKVDKKTGLIQVDATGVSGPLQWGGQPSGVDNSFFNDATCVASDRAKRCTLANPADIGSKTPPAGCTIHLDDGGTPCSAWIKGCTPGSRAASLSQTVDESGNDVVEIQSDILKFRSPLPSPGARAASRGAALPGIGETESYCTGGGFPGEVGDSLECTSDSDCNGVCVTGSTALLETACAADLECDSEGSNDGVCASGSTCQGYAVMTISGNNVYFTGFNVHVRSGSGATDGDTGAGTTINGLGNLVVGYDENGSNDKTGSHNLVVGSYHSYSSYGGFVAGFNNTVSGESSSVSGGASNTASGDYSTVSAGAENYASGDYSAVSGGATNYANSDRSSVSGGSTNYANGESSSVSGGYAGEAAGWGSSVSGGQNGRASGDGSSVSGGFGNWTTGIYSWASGGRFNVAGRICLSGGVSGGPLGFYPCVDDSDCDAAEGTGDGVCAVYTAGQYSSVSGGRFNTAFGDYSSVRGGEDNIASADASSVGGGQGNIAGRTCSGGLVGSACVADLQCDTSEGAGDGVCAALGTGDWSSVSGGRANTASGTYSSVSGGWSSTAGGHSSSVGGGYNNSASGPRSVVGGGFNNIADGEGSSVSGGNSRTAPDFYDWAAGTLLEDF